MTKEKKVLKHIVDRKDFDDYVESIRAFEGVKCVSQMEDLDRHRGIKHRCLVNRFRDWLENEVENILGY